MPKPDNSQTTPGYARRRISVNLKRLRAERRLSQEQLAELAEFHRTYVSQLERCVTNISIDGLERLALSLDIDVLDLLAP
ncbi:MAG: helix-turn-helix transcriptional regulator [Dokdonella sp.]